MTASAQRPHDATLEAPSLLQLHRSTRAAVESVAASMQTNADGEGIGVCSAGSKTADEQRFVWKAAAGAGGGAGAAVTASGTLALAAGQFRSFECLGLVKAGRANDGLLNGQRHGEHQKEQGRSAAVAPAPPPPEDAVVS